MAAKGWIGRSQLQMFLSAVTHMQACVRGKRDRKRAAKERRSARLKAQKAPEPPRPRPKLQVSRTGTLSDGVCFDSGSLLTVARCEACVVVNAPNTQLVRIDVKRYRSARFSSLNEAIEKRFALFAALPVFVEHKENEVSKAAERARESAAEEAAEEGYADFVIVKFGEKAAKAAAASTSRRWDGSLKDLVHNLKEEAFTNGTTIPMSSGGTEMIVIERGSATLLPSDERQRTLPPLELSVGSFYSSQAGAALQSEGGLQLVSHACSINRVSRELVNHFFDNACWVGMQEQAASVVERLVTAGRAFASATASAQRELRGEKELMEGHEGYPRDCHPPILITPVASGLEHLRPIPFGQLLLQTPAEMKAVQYELAKKAELRARMKERSAPSPPSPPPPLSPPVEKYSKLGLPVCTWRCEWCGSSAELGRGKGPNGQVSLCSACSKRMEHDPSTMKERSVCKPKYTCIRCNASFNFPAELVNHTERFHSAERGKTASGLESWSCHWCGCSEKEAVKCCYAWIKPKPDEPLFRTPLCSHCMTDFRAGKRNPQWDDTDVLTKTNEFKQSPLMKTSKSAQLISRLRLGKGFGGDKVHRIGKPSSLEASGPPSPWAGSPSSSKRQSRPGSAKVTSKATSPAAERRRSRSPTLSHIWQAEPPMLGFDEREHLNNVNLRRARAQSDPLELMRYESIGRMTRPRSAAAISFREED